MGNGGTTKGNDTAHPTSKGRGNEVRDMSNARGIVVAALVALSSAGVCAQGERPEGVPEIVIDHERMWPLVDGEPNPASGWCAIPPQHMKDAGELTAGKNGGAL